MGDFDIRTEPSTGAALKFRAFQKYHVFDIDNHRFSENPDILMDASLLISDEPLYNLIESQIQLHAAIVVGVPKFILCKQ